MASQPPAPPSVRRARAALLARADELLEDYLRLLKQAAAAGDYEFALKGYQHLLERLPAEDGVRLLDVSVDKIQISPQQLGPTVQIGIQLGGLARPAAALPEPSIDITSIPEPEPSVDEE
mgnify:CR=1 FL=1